jgi:hypothetical protein
MSYIKNFIRRRYAWSGKRSIIIGVRIPVSWRSCRVEVLRGRDGRLQAVSVKLAQEYKDAR